jgi:tyrosyl-tRNA synthetase
MELAKELKARGLVEQESAPIETILSKKRKAYFGADPTADSLHAGHLVPLLVMRRLADDGHKIVLLVGGATGMIGDPKEKGERPLLDMKTIEKNKKLLKAQIQQIVGARVEMVDNADWLKGLKLLDFLRDIGKHFTVNELVKRELIKRRLDDPNDSISYTEFTYSLLQGFDYLTLFDKKGVDLQIGGSDQWTNILSGVELIRRKLGKEAFAFTTPIITDSAGKKFGKSEGNAVWLDAKKTSPFAFYQFWLNLPDAGIEKYFNFYTFMQVIEINALIEMHKRNPAKREAQKMLASLVTEIVHGKAAAQSAAGVSEVLFGNRSFSELSANQRTMLVNEAPSLKISAQKLATGFTITDALVESQLSTSKSDARRLVEAKGITLNGEAIDSPDVALTMTHFSGNLALLRRGKQVVVLTIEK